MPGAGKSTVGVVLAKVIGYRFVDADLEIQSQTGKRLHELITEHGRDGFIQIENQVCANLDLQHSVIATGGSAIYGKEGMEHLKKISTVVYLKISCDSLQKRLGDLSQRGVVLRPDQTLSDLLEERTPYYEKYADLTIDVENLELREVVAKIKKHLSSLF